MHCDGVAGKRVSIRGVVLLLFAMGCCVIDVRSMVIVFENCWEKMWEGDGWMVKKLCADWSGEIWYCRIGKVSVQQWMTARYDDGIENILFVSIKRKFRLDQMNYSSRSYFLKGIFLFFLNTYGVAGKRVLIRGGVLCYWCLLHDYCFWKLVGENVGGGWMNGEKIMFGLKWVRFDIAGSEKSLHSSGWI